MSIQYAIEQLRDSGDRSPEEVAKRVAVAQVLQGALTVLGEDIPLPASELYPEYVPNPAAVLLTRSNPASRALIARTADNSLMTQEPEKLYTSEQNLAIFLDTITAATQQYAEIAQSKVYGLPKLKRPILSKSTTESMSEEWDYRDFRNGLQMKFAHSVAYTQSKNVNTATEWRTAAGPAIADTADRRITVFSAIESGKIARIDVGMYSGGTEKPFASRLPFPRLDSLMHIGFMMSATGVEFSVTGAKPPQYGSNQHRYWEYKYLYSPNDDAMVLQRPPDNYPVPAQISAQECIKMIDAAMALHDVIDVNEVQG